MESRYGYCQCGCGQKTRISPQNHTQHGWIKGQPLKYMRGHNHSGKRGELCHNWKGGISSNCGYI